LKFWLGRFHQILEDLCALQLLFMVDATRRHAGRTTPPLPAPRRRRNHLAWLFVDASLDTSNGIPATRAHQNATLLCCYVV
jgi:hypothetical protein